MSIPGIQKLYAENHAKGFEVIGVALENDSGSALPGFLREMNMTYAAGLPTSTQEAAAYTSGSIPQMVLVDRAGNIAWSPEPGYSPAMEKELAERVSELLKE
jgi:hypothetical protein